MKLWKRAAGALKDKNSIFAATLCRKTAYRHSDLETAIIKATSHDESSIDYKNAKRVFEWIRSSPIYLKPLAWALTSRMEKTRSWVVALKGLMLMHGIFCCKIVAVQRIGRLPFDLSNFKDRQSTANENSGYNAFVRAYYVYLDQKSAFLSTEGKKNNNISNNSYDSQYHEEPPLLEEITRLQKWQAMLDMLVEIRPEKEIMHVGLIIEAMNNLVIEIYDVHSRIFNKIATVLLRIHADPSKVYEASMVLEIMKRGAMQVEDLILHFKVCREMGVLNAGEFPKPVEIPEGDIRDLERIISNGAGCLKIKKDREIVLRGKEVEVEERGDLVLMKRPDLKTVITDKWEVFEGDSSNHHYIYTTNNNVTTNLINPLLLPDLITF